MPAIVHTQYNDPLPLYSAQTAATEFNQQVQGDVPGATAYVVGASDKRKWDPSRSATYQALLADEDDRRHGGRPVTPHSGRDEEQRRGQEYPDWHGYLTTEQSPSFKRIAGYGGHRAHVHHGPAAPPQVVEYAHGVEDRAAVDPSFAAKIAQAEQPKVPPPAQPHWAAKAEQKHRRWHVVDGEAYEPRDRVSSRRHEAQGAHWAGRGYHSDRWEQHYAGELAGGQQYRPRSRTPGYVQHPREVGTDYNVYYGGQAYSPGGAQRRAKSQEPGAVWRATPRPASVVHGKEWLKPYYVDVVRPGDGDVHSAVISNQYLHHAAGRAHQPDNQYPYGTYYGPQTAYHQQHHQQRYHHQQQHYGSNVYYGEGTGGVHNREFGTDFTRVARSRTPVTPAPTYHQPISVVAPPPPPPPQQQYQSQPIVHSPKIEAPPKASTPVWREPSADRPASGAVRQAEWKYESEAMSNRSVMESEFRRRQAEKAAGQPAPVSPAPTKSTTVDVAGTDAASGFHSVSSRAKQFNQVAVRPGGGPPPGMEHTGIKEWRTEKGPNWYSASGANTKASTSGEYVDAEGNKVTYTKELYTSNDPAGKEYSMLTEEERKVMEQPLEPGVISRHVTTKYYKKSTFSNQQSTTTAQAVPAAPQKLAIEAPPTGEIRPGLSAF